MFGWFKKFFSKKKNRLVKTKVGIKVELNDDQPDIMADLYARVLAPNLFEKMETEEVEENWEPMGASSVEEFDDFTR